jgi:capsular exopolysaccharide synthesis family protein
VELRDFVDTLRRRWLSVVILTALGLAVAAVLGFTATPIYQATTRIFVSTQSVGSAVEAFQGSSYTQARMQSYVEVTTDPLVLDRVIEELNLDANAEALAGRISARVIPDTVLIEIVASSESAEEAAEISNSVARHLRDVVIDDLEEQVGDDSALVNLTVVKRATEPQSPTSPSIPLFLVVGGVLGLIAGLALAFARQALDTRVHSERDVAATTKHPVLAGFLFDPTAAKQPLTVHAGPGSPRAEAFRSLRTSLQFIDFGARSRALVVTSSLASEGKSTIAANLAIALSDAGKSTLLIDADLRRPKVAEYMAVEGGVGLSDVLVGRATLTETLQPWGEEGRLFVLPSGSRPPNPSELLGSDSMAELLETLRGEFDQIIIDAPPLLPVTDAAVLSKVTDGALVVCAVGLTRTTQLSHALGGLENIDAKVLGLVVNMLPTRGPDSYGAYGYEYVEK